MCVCVSLSLPLLPTLPSLPPLSLEVHAVWAWSWTLFKKYACEYFACIFVCGYIHAVSVEGMQSPGTRVTDDYELPYHAGNWTWVLKGASGALNSPASDLELSILLFPAPECWDHRCGPLHLVLPGSVQCLGIKPTPLCMLGRNFTSWITSSAPYTFEEQLCVAM